jgi:thiamine pyrophosphate-dependent acetolactate synthase large subunit-like protein
MLPSFLRKDGFMAKKKVPELLVDVLAEAGILDFGTDLQNPNFAKMAGGAGLLGLTAETPAEVQPLIAQCLKHDGPALVEVLVDRQELSIPPTITAEQAKRLQSIHAQGGSERARR